MSALVPGRPIGWHHTRIRSWGFAGGISAQARREKEAKMRNVAWTQGDHAAVRRVVAQLRAAQATTRAPR